MRINDHPKILIYIIRTSSAAKCITIPALYSGNFTEYFESIKCLCKILMVLYRGCISQDVMSR